VWSRLHQPTDPNSTAPVLALVNENMDARIVSAAMLMDDDLVVPGVRHFSPDMRAVLKRIYGDKYHLRVREQGFICSRGLFWAREDAWKIADQQGQIFLYDPAGKGRKIPREACQGDVETLFSENLY
jgi:hypothetical protein